MHMDINFVRSVLTVVLLGVFIGIVLWAWSGKRKQVADDFPGAFIYPRPGTWRS